MIVALTLVVKYNDYILRQTTFFPWQCHLQLFGRKLFIEINRVFKGCFLPVNVSADFSFWKMTRTITYFNFHEYMTINLLCLPQNKVNYILYHFSVTQYLKKFSLAPEFSEVRNTLCSSKCLQLQLSLLMHNAWISLHSAREELLRVPLLCLVCSTDKIILWRLHRILCLHFDGSSYSFN